MEPPIAHVITVLRALRRKTLKVVTGFEFATVEGTCKVDIQYCNDQVDGYLDRYRSDRSDRSRLMYITSHNDGLVEFI